MQKKSSRRIYGVLGYPVKHSLSPVMHNTAFHTLAINAEYRLFEIAPRDLGDFLDSLSKKGIYGLNVTIPYKEKVLFFLNGYKSSAVKAIGATNTIVVDKAGRLKGFNTDYLGFARHIAELNLKPRRVAIIGAGGAAKAVCFALAKKGAEEIFIYDIDKNKSSDLARKFKKLFPYCKFLPVDAVEDLMLQKKDILVNASPVGMKREDPCLIEAPMLHSGIFIYDLIYNPAETKLLELARNKNCRYANGLNMLLYQGAESFNLWMKPKKAPIKIMQEALRKAIAIAI